MARVPDRFDLWVRKARETNDTARQADLVLGALAAGRELYFFNLGTKEAPHIARTLIEAEEGALVFSNAERIAEFLAQHPRTPGKNGGEHSAITSPTTAALAWCVKNELGLMINPDVGETVFVPTSLLATFVAEWKKSGERQSAGFWIPNMTSEEEDFWQEHGL